MTYIENPKTKGSACVCDKCCGVDPLPCGCYPDEYCDCEENGNSNGKQNKR